VGSPITFSGFNQIDFNMILNAVMQQERAPLNRLETRKKTLDTQNTAFSTLAGKLSSLESAIENLGKDKSLALLTASSSDPGVGVSATGGTVTGTYDVIVSELARAQVTASQSTYTALTDVVATGGTLTLDSASGDPVTITISGSTTLSQLAAAINADDDSPAAASVVQSSPGVYQLVLTGKDTGSTNAFTITNSLTGGAGVTFEATNRQDAINAQFSVNGLDVISASNTVTDVIEGATLSLVRKDPATTVTVKVGRDTSGATDLVKKFISTYNDLTTFAKDQNTAAIAGKDSIGRDPLLRGLRDAFRSAISAEYTGGTRTRLAELGIGFDMTGKMTLDETIFEAAVNDSPADVQLLLSGTDGTGGAFGAMKTLVEEYTETGGLIGATRSRIDEQVRGLNRRMDTVSAQLELRRAALQREYMAADLAMTRLKSQSASLSSVGGGYRLF
jgi:flagellar hook-associated protein 2